MKIAHAILCILLVSICSTIQAQKAYLADPDNFDPESETKLMVDINKCDCQRLLGSTEPIYLWTWKPAELPASSPKANGSWTASNTALEMTDEGGGIYSFTMVPTEFYEVDAAKVYEEDFSFLLKAFDGTGDGGGGCDEDKTEDLSITVDPPVTPAQVVSGFPSTVFPDDIFTLRYDNNIEEKEAMQNLNGEDLYMYTAVMADSAEYRIANFFSVQDFPELKLDYQGDGLYTLSLVPNEFYANIVPAGAELQSMEFSIRKAAYTGTGDKSDSELTVVFGCAIE